MYVVFCGKERKEKKKSDGMAAATGMGGDDGLGDINDRPRRQA